MSQSVLPNKDDNSQSVYAPPPHRTRAEMHTLSILLENQPGALSRVVGLFTGRGYNIESLTVAETDHDQHISRITIVNSGSREVLELIKVQLEGLVHVHSVRDLTSSGPHIAAELALVKSKVEFADRIAPIAEDCGAKERYRNDEVIVYEAAGTVLELDYFTDRVRDLGLIDIARSGVAAISHSARSVDEVLA